jgi:hypothetical protein
MAAQDRRFIPMTMLAASRVSVLLLALPVWWMYYLIGRLAYRFPKSARKICAQISLVAAAVLIFVLQLRVIAPQDAHGMLFNLVILIDWGGGLAVLFATLIRERAKHAKP